MNRLKLSKKVTTLFGPCFLRGEGFESYLDGTETVHLSDLAPVSALEEVSVGGGVLRRRQGKWRITVEFEPIEGEEPACTHCGEPESAHKTGGFCERFGHRQ